MFERKIMNEKVATIFLERMFSERKLDTETINKLKDDVIFHVMMEEIEEGINNLFDISKHKFYDMFKEIIKEIEIEREISNDNN